MMLLLRRTTSLSIRVLTSRVVGARKYSRDYDSSDDEKEPKAKQKKSKHDNRSERKSASTPSTTDGGSAEEPAVTRLNRLLASMPTENTYSLTNKNNVILPRPGEAHKKRKEASKQESASKDIFVAAKRVASLAGDGEQKQQVESELLAKLLGHNQEENVEGVTSGDAPKKPVAELSLSELIVGMKIDRTNQPKEQSRGEFVRRAIEAKTQKQQGQGRYNNNNNNKQQGQPPSARKERIREAATYTGSVNLFGSQPLGIFKNKDKLQESPDMLSTWAHLQQNELKLLVTHPPANYLEKLILWTEQGKVWHFPIDNEQDLHDEVNVDFSEHIFLEQHLEGWCPEKGPIRHYMELVCVGLSKNPYLTAKEKKEHILWYRDYFETKKDILKDLITQEKNQGEVQQKKVEA